MPTLRVNKTSPRNISFGKIFPHRHVARNMMAPGATERLYVRNWAEQRDNPVNPVSNLVDLKMKDFKQRGMYGKADGLVKY